MTTVTAANKGRIITPSGFSGYDLCLNPYVGCEFSCSFCYVRFFVKDKDHAWGDFVRRRDHINERLPRELPQHAGKRLVFGTMTDPYQPEERRARLTRTALQHIAAMREPLAKVGLYTRSPIVTDDLALIAKMPRARVHFSITPLSHDVTRAIERIAIPLQRRFAVIRELRGAGIRVHCNVAPAIPLLSDPLTEEIAGLLADAQIDEFFVDPIQAYAESWRAMTAQLRTHALWPQVHEIVTNKAKYAAHKAGYAASWRAAWRAVAHRSPHTLAIQADHENRTWRNMLTGEAMNRRAYGDDLRDAGVAPPGPA